MEGIACIPCPEFLKGLNPSVELLTAISVFLDFYAYLHKYANMRTSLDFPDPMFRHLKAKAALEGISMRELVLSLIEKGLSHESRSASPSPHQALPSISLGTPMPLAAERFSNAELASLLDD